MKEPEFIVVVGTSAGGINALSELVAQFSLDMNIAVFIVMHLSRTSVGDFLVQRLRPHTVLHCEVARDGAAIEPGHIYIAAPNFHLLVKKNGILLGKGPEENRWRPSIDVLFRSAAVSFTSRAIGIVLTGALDDGTAGMSAIKRSGGTTIVQDPNQAQYPDMPLSVLDNMEVDYCLPLSRMGAAIEEILKTEPAAVEPPADIKIESEIAEKVVIGYENIAELGKQSFYGCPDCGGGLWKINKQEGSPDRYRCHVGHSYSEADLVTKQGQLLQTTLWMALRIMEERRNLLKKMETDNPGKGLSILATGYAEKGKELQFHIDKMKELLFATQRAL